MKTLLLKIPFFVLLFISPITYFAFSKRFRDYGDWCVNNGPWNGGGR